MHVDHRTRRAGAARLPDEPGGAPSCMTGGRRRGSRRALARASTAAAIALLAISPLPTRASTFEWTNAVNGDYADPTKWLRTSGATAAPPTTGDTANFNEPSATAYTVTFATNHTALTLNVSAGDVAFAGSGTNAVRAYALANVNVTGGRLTVGASGNPLALSSSSALTLSNATALDVVHGSSLTTSVLSLGAAAGSTDIAGVYVDGAGTTFSVTGGANQYVGRNGGYGKLVVQNGAGGTIAGSLRLVDSVVANSKAVLSVLSGATLTIDSLFAGTGNVAGQSAVVTVSSSTLTQTGASTFTLGTSGTNGSYAHFAVLGNSSVATGAGQVTVNRTGLLEISSTTFGQPATLFVNGNLLVDGGTLVARTNSNSVGRLQIASGRSVTVQNGGLLDLGHSPLDFDAGTRVTLTGGSTLNSQNRLRFAGGTQFNISGSAVANLRYRTVLAGTGTSVASMTVNGGQIRGGGFLVVGESGRAELTLADRAVAELDGLSIASNFYGGSPDATVRLQGESFIETGVLTVASDAPGGTATANGALLIDSGSGVYVNRRYGQSTVVGTTSLTSPGAIRIAGGGYFQSAGGHTRINPSGLVDVADGQLDLSGPLTVDGGRIAANGPNASFRWGGDGATNRALAILNGGSITHPYFYIVEGQETTVRISGTAVTTLGPASSTLDVRTTAGDYDFHVADHHYTIDGGGVLKVDTLAFDRGSLLVDGPESAVQVAAAGRPSYVGYGSSHGPTNLTLRNRAQLAFPGRLDVAAHPETVVNLRVESGADLTAPDLLVGLPSLPPGVSWTASAGVVLTGPGSTLVQTSPTGALRIAPLLGSGTHSVTVANGALLRAAGPTFLGADAVLDIDGGSVDLQGLTGEGTIHFAAGALAINDDLRIGFGAPLGANPVLATPHHLTLGGVATIDPLSSLTIDGGRLTAADLAVGGTLFFKRGTLAISGTAGVSFAPGQILGQHGRLDSGQTLNAAARTTVTAGASLTIAGGALNTGSVSNAGTLHLDAGSVAVTGPINNLATGRIFVGPGGFFDAAGTVTNAGRIELLGTAAKLSGAGTLRNAGLIVGHGEVALPLDLLPTGELRADDGKRLVFTGLAAAFAHAPEPSAPLLLATSALGVELSARRRRRPRPTGA